MTPTKIVATLGPATLRADRVRELVQAGVSVFRLNFSHGTPAEHERAAQLVREAAADADRAIALLGDLQGPKIRTGPLAGKTVQLAAGGRFTITTRPVPGDAIAVSTTYPDLPRYVQDGQRLFLDDGRLELRVTAVRGADIECAIVTGGELREQVGINLPDVQVNIPSLTEKDRADLERCIDWRLDYVAMSFVQHPDDIKPLRAALKARRSPIAAIAKIEKPAAVAHLMGILRAFDGVMVARGDLAVETSIAEVPVFQQRIIAAANALGKPVITATQMLESMTHSPRPTRAEASDVANAVWDGTDAVMLSGETAIGEYPVLTVETMAQIIEEAGAHGVGRPLLPVTTTSSPQAVMQAACFLAADIDAAALVVLTRSGRTAQLASRERPAAPIFAMTDNEVVYRQLALWWGVQPFICRFRQSTDEMLVEVARLLLDRGVVAPGQLVVFTGAAPVASRGRTNFVQVQRMPRQQ